MFHRLLLGGLAGLVLLLAACGDGGGGEPTASPTPVATATPPAVAVPAPPREFTGAPPPPPPPGPPRGHPPAPPAEPASYGGDILILDDSGSGYEVVYRGTVRGEETVLPERFLNPTILGTGDYNDDGKAEAAFTGSQCGAAGTCTTSVFVVGWNGTQYSDFFAEPVSEPWTRPSEIDFEDLDADGAQEIRVPAGTISSPGLGPQRNSVLTYDWDGAGFTLTDIRYAPSRSEERRVGKECRSRWS